MRCRAAILLFALVSSSTASVESLDAVRLFGIVKRAGGKPVAGVFVAAVEDPRWWALETSKVHREVRTNGYGKFELTVPSYVVRRSHLVAVGEVRTSRREDGTIVHTGTSVRLKGPINTKAANVIVVPNDFVPAAR